MLNRQIHIETPNQSLTLRYGHWGMLDHPYQWSHFPLSTGQGLLRIFLPSEREECPLHCRQLCWVFSIFGVLDLHGLLQWALLSSINSFHLAQSMGGTRKRMIEWGCRERLGCFLFSVAISKGSASVPLSKVTALINLLSWFSLVPVTPPASLFRPGEVASLCCQLPCVSFLPSGLS